MILVMEVAIGEHGDVQKRLINANLKCLTNTISVKGK